MRCGLCDKTDGLCYTSNPPKVKCTITGEFHEYGDNCDAIFMAKICKPLHEISCLICGETVRTCEGPIVGPEVCDKCKAAILKMRCGLVAVAENATTTGEGG